MSGLPGKSGRRKTEKAQGDSREPIEVVVSRDQTSTTDPASGSRPNVLALALRGGFFSGDDADLARNAQALRDTYRPESVEAHTQVEMALMALHQLRRVAAALP